MSILKAGYNEIEPEESMEGRETQPKKYKRNLLGFIDYLFARGGKSPSFLIDTAQSAAKFARKMRVGNRRFKMLLDVIEYGVPAAVFTSDLFSKLLEFDKFTKSKPNVYSEREHKIRRLLGFDDGDPVTNIIGGSFVVGKDVCTWIASRPKTSKFIIEGFYKYDDLKASQSLWDVERGDVFVVISFEQRRYVWQISYIQHEGQLSINDSVIYFPSTSAQTTTAQDSGPYPKRTSSKSTTEANMVSGMDRLKKAVFNDFLEYFDVHNNVIYLSRGLSSRKRIVFQEPVNQYDIEAFVGEVRKVLKRGRKRGYAFVGIPGTGKSTIIRKLENIIRDYPIVYINPENMNYCHDIIEIFRTISYMQPCIVVLEDLDSFDFEEKIKKALKNCVKKEDLLIHLGDVCIGNDIEHNNWFKKELGCKTYLVRGNHDNKSLNWYFNNGWDVVADRLDIEMFGKKMCFTHIPVAWDGYFDINYHGHFHDTDHRRNEPEFNKVLSGYNKLISLENLKYQPLNLK